MSTKPKTPADRIRELYAQGKDQAQILDAIKDEFPNLKGNKRAAYVRTTYTRIVKANQRLEDAANAPKDTPKPEQTKDKNTESNTADNEKKTTQTVSTGAGSSVHFEHVTTTEPPFSNSVFTETKTGDVLTASETKQALNGDLIEFTPEDWLDLIRAANDRAKEIPELKSQALSESEMKLITVYLRKKLAKANGGLEQLTENQLIGLIAGEIIGTRLVFYLFEHGKELVAKVKSATSAKPAPTKPDNYGKENIGGAAQ